jgi:hypothetical protein
MNIKPLKYLADQAASKIYQHYKFPYTRNELKDIALSYLFEMYAKKPEDTIINKHITFMYIYGRLQKLKYKMSSNPDFEVGETKPDCPIDELMLRKMLHTLNKSDRILIESLFGIDRPKLKYRQLAIKMGVSIQNINERRKRIFKQLKDTWDFSEFV